MNAITFLRLAESLIARRQRDRGSPEEFLKAVAKRWSLTLGIPITPVQVVLCQLDVKQQRMCHNVARLDAILDTAAEVAVLAQVAR